jgi:hypothetical protein
VHDRLHGTRGTRCDLSRNDADISDDGDLVHQGAIGCTVHTTHDSTLALQSHARRPFPYGRAASELASAQVVLEHCLPG